MLLAKPEGSQSEMRGCANMSFCEHGEEQYCRWPAELVLAAKGLSCMEFDYSNLYHLLDINVSYRL